jgi:AmmeMemoRadiSam system protein A
MFGHSEVELGFANDTKLADLIITIAMSAGISAGHVDPKTAKKYTDVQGLDHGALVPLYFVDKIFRENDRSFKLVHISTPFLPSESLYAFGKVIASAVEESGRKAVYLASGDLSHMLTPDAPAGYDPKGQKYDDRLVGYLRDSDVGSVLAITENEMHEAGECGTRSFMMALGALQSKTFKTEIYSYEGPFGVGYLCAGLLLTDPAKSHVYPDLARFTVERHVKERKVIKPDDFFKEKDFQIDANDLSKKAGVFVSIKKNGELRGCIGTIAPTCENILVEIVQNAVSASSQDPRFEQVREEELADLSFSVDVLGDPVDISSLDELDPGRYGVIVTRGYRRGLLLPDLEGVDTPHEQVMIALRKAGISPSEQYSMQRFEVIRYHEQDEGDKV